MPDKPPHFGDDLQIQEESRAFLGWIWLDRLRQDLAYGGRALRNAAGFTLTAVLILALGIGIPLTAFRVRLADLQGTSAPDPESLVRLTRRAPGVRLTTLTFPELEFYAANARSFRTLIGISRRNPASLGDGMGAAAAGSILAGFATSNYFTEFGVVPLLGRVLTPDDERPDSEPTAVIGESFWRRQLGGDQSAVGRSIRVNGKPIRVVGVVPQSAESRDDVWLPLVRQPYLFAGSRFLTSWNSSLELYGRLQPGVSPEASQQETAALAARLHEQAPDHIWKDEYLHARPVLTFDRDSEEFELMLTSAALVTLLLVAASANLGTLMLARGVAREREIRIRLALGASRLRVVRQLFTESLLLAVIGGVGALILSTIALKGFQLDGASTASLVPDWRSLMATVSAVAVASAIFGIPPALRLATLTPAARRTHSFFVASQVMISCLLLILSGLLVKNARKLGEANPGFDHRHLAWISPGLASHGYGEPAAHAYLDALRTQISALPGVVSVAPIRVGPWDDFHVGAFWHKQSYSGNRVDAGFLRTMGLSLLRGRNFEPAESGAVIINEATAKSLWPNEEALGKSLPWEPAGQTVIGVVGNASTAYVGDTASREYYSPLLAGDALDSVLLVRVAGAPRDYVRRLQDAARSLDQRLLPTVQIVTDRYDRELHRASGALAIIGTLGGMATVLSVVGLAGLAGYTVAQRTREIGIRMALGAGATDIIGAILRPFGWPIASGFALGALGGLAVSAILRGTVPTMSALNIYDPLPYGAALALFAAVIALAVSGPGWRATHINPSQALQHE